MSHDHLQIAAEQIHGDLIGIARMFAAAERYSTAIRVQGLARMILDEANPVDESKAAGCTAESLKIAS